MHRGRKVTLAGFIKAYKHLLQKSARHKKDVLMTDALSERKSVMEDMYFEPVFRHVNDFEELQSHAKETSVSKGGYRRKVVGTRFIWSPPDTAQALIHALPESERRDMLAELQNAYDQILERSFGTQPRVMAIHTDKVRQHIETIILRFQKDKTAHPAFHGTSRGHTDDTSQAVSAAQFGCTWKFKYFHSRMAYEMTRCVMEKIRDVYTSKYDKEPDACLHRLAIANEYLDFLTIATTDETLSARNSLRKSADFKRPDLPFRYYLDKRIPDPEPVHNPPNFILRARIRIHRILLRREREKNWLRQKLSRQARMILYAFARRPHISARFKGPDGDAMVKAAAMEIEQSKLMSGIEEGILVHHSSSVREIAAEVKAAPETIPRFAEKGTSVADEHPEPAAEETKNAITTADKPEPEPEPEAGPAMELEPAAAVEQVIGNSSENSRQPKVDAFRTQMDPLFQWWFKKYQPTPSEHGLKNEDDDGTQKFLDKMIRIFEEHRSEISADFEESEPTKQIGEEPKI